MANQDLICRDLARLGRAGLDPRHVEASWAYVLEDEDPATEPTRWRWQGWKRYGGILLASERIRVDDGRELPLGNIAVNDRLPDSVFGSPAPPGN